MGDSPSFLHKGTARVQKSNHFLSARFWLHTIKRSLPLARHHVLFNLLSSPSPYGRGRIDHVELINMLCILPNELLLQIFRNLVVLQFDCHSSIPVSLDRSRLHGLASICSCCHRLRAVAEPILYSTFVWRDVIPHPTASDGDQPLLPNHRLRSFLHAIITRPDLATHVRHLTMRQFDHPGQLVKLFNKRVPLLDPLLARLYQEASAQVSLGNSQDSWSSALAQGDEAAEITLLSALLFNVTQLNLLFPAWGPTPALPFYRAFLLEAVKPRPAHGPHFGTYTNIECLTVSNWISDKMATGMPIWSLSEFLLIPTLRRVYYIGAREEEDLTRWACPPGASNISQLHLTDSLVSAAGLELFIRSCAALEKLTLRYTHSTAFGHFGERDVDWQRVGKALYAQRYTLQHLDLNAEDQSPIKLAPWMKFLDPIGSLQDFTALKTISIHQWILLGRDIWHEVEASGGLPTLPYLLPQSLVTLKLLQCTPRIMFQLQKLHGAVRAGNFPGLIAIHIDWDHRLANAIETCARAPRNEALVNAYAQRGVKWTESNRRRWHPDMSLSKYNPSRIL